MQKTTKFTPKNLKSLGLFTAKQARTKIGVSQPTLSRWVKGGLINRAGRGLYFHPESKIKVETLDFTVACLKFCPHSAIAGLSALFHYGLIEQIPGQIWVLVSPTRTDRNHLYRCLRSKTTLAFGINSTGSYRITTIERTLIEGFKFANKIGLRLAIGAIRKAFKEGLTDEKKIVTLAKKLKLQNVIEKYWEMIVS